MMLAAHSVLDPQGELIAACPNRDIAREIGETFCIITDLNYTFREATPDELLGMLAEPSPPRDQRFRSLPGVGQSVVVIPNFRDEPVEPVDN